MKLTKPTLIEGEVYRKGIEVRIKESNFPKEQFIDGDTKYLLLPDMSIRVLEMGYFEDDWKVIATYAPNNSKYEFIMDKIGNRWEPYSMPDIF